METAFDQQGTRVVARGIAELRKVAHAHTVFVAGVHDHMLRRLQAARQCDVARQDARQQQGRARLVHGMQVQQPVRTLHPGAQRRASLAVGGGGVVQALGAPDAVHVFGNEARGIVLGQIEAVKRVQVAEGQRQAAPARLHAGRQQILQRPRAAQFVAVHQRAYHQRPPRHAGIKMPDARRIGIARAFGGEVGNGKLKLHGEIRFLT